MSKTHQKAAVTVYCNHLALKKHVTTHNSLSSFTKEYFLTYLLTGSLLRLLTSFEIVDWRARADLLLSERATAASGEGRATVCDRRSRVACLPGCALGMKCITDATKIYTGRWGGQWRGQEWWPPLAPPWWRHCIWLKLENLFVLSLHTPSPILILENMYSKW